MIVAAGQLLWRCRCGVVVLLVGVDEAKRLADSPAERTGRRIPDADFAPIARRRDVFGQGTTLDHAGTRPIGMIQEHATIVDYAINHRDMAKRHCPACAKSQHRPCAGLLAAPIDPGCLTPPRVGIAAKRDPGNGTRISNALQDAASLDRAG